MKQKILDSVVGVLVSQASKYMTEPLVLPEGMYEKTENFIDRVEHEMRPFDGIDLEKPVTVAKALSRFAKSKIKRQEKRAVYVPKADLTQILKGLDRIIPQWTGDKAGTWMNYDVAYYDYIKRLLESEGLSGAIVEGATPTKRDSAYKKAQLIMLHNPSKFMRSAVEVLATDDVSNILTRHLMEQNELTVLAQARVNEDELAKICGHGGYTISLTLYGAYAKVTKKGLANPGYAEYKDYVCFIVADVNKSYVKQVRRDDVDKEGDVQFTFNGPTLYDKSLIRPELRVLFVPSVYKEESGRISLEDMIRSAFWERSSHIVEIYDVADKPWLARSAMSQFLEVSEYHGEEKKLWEDWKSYMEAGVPITALLWGRPGCGKTTLIREGIQQISTQKKRCLMIDNTIYRRMTNGAWKWVMEKYQPDVVWVDDIDRVDRSDLGQSLSRIDRNNYKIPCTIFTSNSLRRIPPAFYRTDRIDYIYEIKTSDASLALMVESLLEREGVVRSDLTEADFKALLEASKDGTAADMLKYIRRGKILGWDQMICPFDRNERVNSDED